MTESNRLPILAEEIKLAHSGVQDAAQTATERAIEAGHALTEAKALVKHGEWLPWLKTNCLLSERTAQAYMRLVRKHGEFEKGKAQRVADLPVREAMKAIAETRGECPDPAETDIWAWAKVQVAAPITRFDYDNPVKSLSNKLLSQVG